MASNDSGKDDWQDVPIDDWQDVTVNPKQKEPLISRIGKGVLSGVAKASRAVDSVTGAPVRSAVGALQEGGGLGEAAKAYGHQFAEDPSAAPSGKDIAAKMGLSTEENIDTGLHLSPYGGALHLSPAGFVGAGVEAATDPLSYVGGKPFELAGKAALSGAEMAAPRLAEYLGGVAERRAAKAATGQSVNALRNISGTTLKSAGDFEKAQGKVQKVGRDILDEGVLSPLDKVETLAPKLSDTQQKYGDLIGSIGEEIDAKAPKSISGQNIAAQLNDYARSVPQTVAGKNLAARIKAEAKNFQEMGDIGFKEAQDLKNQFKYKATDADSLISNQDVTNKIQGIISGEMDNTADALAKDPKLGIDSDLLNQYQEAKQKYGSFKKTADAATARSVQNQSNRIVAPSDYGVGGVVGATTMMTGHDPTATALITGISLMAHKVARERGSALAATSLDWLSKALASKPELMQKYGPVLTKAMNYGPDSLVVTHHLLMNNDPNYKEAVEGQ